MADEALRFLSPDPGPTMKDNPLNKLIRRLEAATSRLEDIASSAATFEGGDGPGDGSLAAAASLPASNSMPELTGGSKDGTREASTSTVSSSVRNLCRRV